MATKRRKVWVSEYKPGGLGTTAHDSRYEARRSGGHNVVAFVERLPGDVVLSREEWARAGADAVVALVAKGWSKRDAGEAVQAFGSALLRGRR